MRSISKDGGFLRRHVTPERLDCQALYEEGFMTGGVYAIRPPGGDVTDTWCDMEDGGWTVISLRRDGSEDFNRGWEQYVAGFGNRTGEFWLGLENIHRLTLLNTSVRVYVDSLGDKSPSAVNAIYSTFVVNDESTNYRLEIGGFTGNCGDSMAYHNGMQFTTFDNDNDRSSVNCAVKFTGGNWFKACHEAHPNGLYLGGAHDQDGKGLSWNTCWKHNYSARIFINKIKRN
ncbi:MFAP4-like protein [Mya arenaria]|uniref:MFAP4-like protein n=1 Tax=Mya arenaria TaxID=6604 RepID=A0ABY7GDX1_MYAAR|nr:MFAP4-like protein [Mya arenaria]